MSIKDKIAKMPTDRRAALRRELDAADAAARTAADVETRKKVANMTDHEFERYRSDQMGD